MTTWLDGEKIDASEYVRLSDLMGPLCERLGVDVKRVRRLEIEAAPKWEATVYYEPADAVIKVLP